MIDASPGNPKAMAVGIVVLRHRDQVLVRRRPDDPLLEDLWEFPGGKLKIDECPEEAAARELIEETGIPAPKLHPLHEAVHEYPDRTLHLHFFIGELQHPSDSMNESTWQWLSLDTLDDDNVPEANRPVLRQLKGVDRKQSRQTRSTHL